MTGLFALGLFAAACGSGNDAEDVLEDVNGDPQPLTGLDFKEHGSKYGAWLVAEQQLLDQVSRIFRELHRVIVSRQQRRLVEAECVLQVGAAREQLRRALDECAQYQPCCHHQFRAIYGGVQFHAADPETVEEGVEQVLGRNVHRLIAGRRVVRRVLEYFLFLGFRLRLGFLLLLAEQHRLEFLVTRYLVLVEQLHAGLEDFLVDKLLEMIGRDRLLVGVQRHRQALALVDTDLELEVPQSGYRANESTVNAGTRNAASENAMPLTTR